MQLSAFADLESGIWDVAVDGRWLGAGPGEAPFLDFASFDSSGLDSARLLALWLENGESYTLSALRPRGAKGQDRDDIRVRLPEAQAPAQVFDPRLSTEYTADGTPQRFGIELWLGEDSDAEQRPLRLAGESDGQALSEAGLQVFPMRAHSADVRGRGLYLLVRGT